MEEIIKPVGFDEAVLEESEVWDDIKYIQDILCAILDCPVERCDECVLARVNIEEFEQAVNEIREEDYGKNKIKNRT